MKKEKSSLEKSHSAWSNTKLTLLCILTIIFVTVLWAVLIAKNRFSDNVFYILLGSSFALSVLCLLLFNKFKR